MTFRTIFAVAACILLLAACGGGSGPGSTAISEAERSLELRTMVQKVIDRSDTLLATEQHVFEVGDSANYPVFGRIRTNCRGDSCSGIVLGEGTVRLSDLSPEDEMHAVFERGGIQLATGSSAVTEHGATANQYSFGGWLDHNAFFILSSNFYRGVLDPANFKGLLTGAISFGDDTGTRPVSGSAKWTGAMVGVEEFTFLGVHGDAAVTVDFETAKAGVALTDIVYMNSGASLPSMSWSGLDIGANGKFTAPSYARGFQTPGAEGLSLVGTFYGPNHEEVGGVFERDRIAGAFGAKRE